MNPANTTLKLISEANFDSHVLQSSGDFLVLFWAPWSKPCQVIEPVLVEVAQTCTGKIAVVKIDADDNPFLGLRFAAQHIPTLLYFRAGELRGRLVGTASKEAILNLVHWEGEAAPGTTASENGGAS